MCNETISIFSIFQCTRTLPHKPSQGDLIMWTGTHKVDVDGGEAVEVVEGSC